MNGHKNGKNIVIVMIRGFDMFVKTDKRSKLIDFYKKLWYNTPICNQMGVNAKMSNTKRNTNLGRNAELGFLYKIVSYRANVISEMAFVPEYIEAIKSYSGDLNDRAVYEVIKITYKKMLADGKSYRTARDVMLKVSKDYTGDSMTWEND